MKIVKIVLILSVGLNLIAIYFGGKKLYQKYKASNTSSLSQENTNYKYWFNRDKLFEVLPKDSNSIVFLGNSLTQNFELTEFLPKTNIKNRGIIGDDIPGLINRITPIIQSRPKKIFIEIGINDLGTGVSRELVLTNYKRLIVILRKELKATKIYIQSILPVENQCVKYQTYCNKKVNREIKLINNELLKYTKEHNLTFVDLYQKFQLGGQLNPKYSLDGLHLNGEGYLLWADILHPYVYE